VPAACLHAAESLGEQAEANCWASPDQAPLDVREGLGEDMALPVRLAACTIGSVRWVEGSTKFTGTWSK